MKIYKIKSPIWGFYYSETGINCSTVDIILDIIKYRPKAAGDLVKINIAIIQVGISIVIENFGIVEFLIAPIVTNRLGNAWLTIYIIGIKK